MFQARALEGQKIEERAVIRANVENLCTAGGNLIPSYIESDNSNLMHLADVVGIDLGIAIDMADHNVELMKDLVC